MLASAHFSRNAPRARVIRQPHAASAFCIRLAAASATTSARSSSSSSSSSSSPRLPDSIVQEQDIVLLKRVFGKPYEALTKPLKHGRKIKTRFGSLDDSDIIGRAFLDTLASSTGHAVRIHAPTLAEYVTLTPRLVTPVYPHDATLIVSLLDVHVTPPPAAARQLEPASSRLDILEAGTGHGSLTLYLARAIHAANPPRPPPAAASSDEEAEEAKLSAWRATRKAVIHTVDVSSLHSDAAQKIVTGFRRGLYAGNVDFHVGDVTEFINKHTQGGATPQPFSHVLLDLPDVQSHIPAAASALRDGGMLLVFCPSVTQIAQCVATIRAQGLPLIYSQVLELGPGLSGGKLWDVRPAKVRSSAKERSVPHPENPPSNSSFWSKIRLLVARLLGIEAAESKQQERWEMVCRPSVGHVVVGGGFVGVWRRKKISGDGAGDEPKPEA